MARRKRTLVNLILSTLSLFVILSITTLAQPTETAAFFGCSEKIACATVEVCDMERGEECEEEECEGWKQCMIDELEECDDWGICAVEECEVLTCSDWHG